MNAIDRLAHTPGPWALRQHGPHHFTVTGQAPGLIADIHTDRDAALIAAAPELLAALELIAGLDRQDADVHRMFQSARRISRAAIAKIFDGRP